MTQRPPPPPGYEEIAGGQWRLIKKKPPDYSWLGGLALLIFLAVVCAGVV